MVESRLGLMSKLRERRPALSVGWIPPYVRAVQERVGRKRAECANLQRPNTRPRADELSTLLPTTALQLLPRRTDGAREADILGERISLRGFRRSGLPDDGPSLPRFDRPVQGEGRLTRLGNGIVREPLIPSPHRFNERAREVSPSRVLPCRVKVAVMRVQVVA